MEEFRGSPYRRGFDVEGGNRAGFDDDDDDASDPFHITSTKNASIERLKRWRQAALVLNASRRFRYTLDLKKEEEKKQMIRKIRTHAQVIRAAYLFKEAGEKAPVTPKVPSEHGGDYEIGQDELVSMSREHDFSLLEQYGGASGLAQRLNTNVEKGIPGDDDDVQKRKNVYGSNTYPQKKGRSFWRFLWEAWQDLTLIILMVAAAASLALGIKSEGIKEGWYDGGSIAFAVILVIVVTAVSDYRQSLQFQSLNDEKRNIHLEVIRGGRRVAISIFDIVVGDVIPLKIGDQVPADGILIAGQSLAIDESSMTGESKIVTKDLKQPFLMSGCKVADGYGTMLVTSVGINTEWGLLMASISEDTGEETPLQVRLNGLATFIGIVGLSVAFVVLLVLLARYFSGHTYNSDGSAQFRGGHTTFSHAIDGAIKIVTIAEVMPIIHWETSTFSIPVLAVILFLSVALFPTLLLPSTPSMWVAGMTFGYGFGFLLIFSAVKIGVSLPYFIGNLFHHKIQAWLERYPKKASVIRLAGEGDWMNQFQAVFLIRVSPFPYILYNYCAVATSVKFGPYFFGSMMGMIPDVLVAIYTGILIRTLADASHEHHNLSKQQIIFDIIGFITTATTTVICTVLAKKRLKKIQMEEDMLLR